ncbi:MAG: hypothetical protein KAJ03_04220 [Gammaproteobacteria bacterium]|nr:hypothetical protein [Gammaproteobacteria bacterium]
MSADKPSVSQRRKKKNADKAVETAKGLSIADRLTRRGKEKTVSIDMSDGAGDYAIICRQPTRAEMDTILQLQQKLQAADTQYEANAQLAEMLADLCEDESLDVDFWLAGHYSLGDLFAIIGGMFAAIADEVKTAQGFR